MSVTSSSTAPERRRNGARLPDVAALARPLQRLARARTHTPIAYVELVGDLRGAGVRAACKRAVAVALREAAGTILRAGDLVAAGPGATWFVVVLAGRHAGVPSAAPDDLGGVALRLAGIVRAALAAEARRAGAAAVIGVRAGWTVYEPRPRESAIAALRHAVRTAAVVARVEERRAHLLAAVSHELRTPLTAVIGYAERLRTKPGGSAAERARAVRFIESEARRLHRLVEGLLDVGAWSAGGLRVHREAVELTDVVAEAIRIVAPPARRRAVKVRCTGRGLAVGDRERLLHVFVNLLDNAMRYATTRIVVRIARRAGDIRTSVTDDGPGMPDDVRRSFGAPLALSARGRIGLGAALSRLIVEAHGGTLRAGNVRGGGAQVMVALPAADDR